MTKLSIIVPVYNERNYIQETIKRLSSVNFNGLDKEIIIVDDGSTDGTRELLVNLPPECRVILHKNNRGKGAALISGFAAATGQIIAIQDADLEYHPQDLTNLVESILDGRAVVVYGSRMTGRNPIGYQLYYFGNKLISFMARVLYGCHLTDIETGYKVFTKDILSKFKLELADFGFEAEFTAKLLKNKIKILEIPISYTPRHFAEGKKIGPKDGFKALWLLIKYRFVK
ncbi:MAG: glycosyltransferase family 2 protein [Patescibacteria group bacterium]|nr:glycosyltransferase family 2 protein [Patescibacteria group bacterium]